MSHKDGVFSDRSGKWAQVAKAPADYKVWSLWGSGEDNIVAVAVPKYALQQPHLALRFDGAQWKQEKMGIYPNIWGLHGSAKDSLYAAGGNHQCGAIAKGTIGRYDGKGWKVVARIPECAFAVWTEGPGRFWVAGADPCSSSARGYVRAYDGGKVTKHGFPKAVWSIWGRTAETLVVTTGGGVYYRDCK